MQQHRYLEEHASQVVLRAQHPELGPHPNPALAYGLLWAALWFGCLCAVCRDRKLSVAGHFLTCFQRWELYKPWRVLPGDCHPGGRAQTWALCSPRTPGLAQVHRDLKTLNRNLHAGQRQTLPKDRLRVSVGAPLRWHQQVCTALCGCAGPVPLPRLDLCAGPTPPQAGSLCWPHPCPGWICVLAPPLPRLGLCAGPTPPQYLGGAAGRL